MILYRGSPRRGGSTAIETALVLPVLFLLMFAIVDFGRYFYVQHTIQYALREGLRVGLVGKSGQGASRAEWIDGTIKMKASLPGIESSKLTVTMYPLAYNSNTGKFTDPGKDDGSQNAGVGGDYMKIKIKYPFKGATWVLGKKDREIRAEAVYRNEMF